MKAEALADRWDSAEIGDEGAVRAPLPLPCELFDTIIPKLDGRWLVKSLLMASAATLVFGFPGCGKSFLAVDLSLHIAAGQEWFGRRVEAGAVAYVAAEGQGGMRARVEAWKAIHGRRDIPFALIPAAVDLLDPAADLAKLRTVLDYLFALWGRLDLLVIDTLPATFGGGDENGSDMAVYVANVERLCAPYGAARMIVTHVPLNSEAKRPRGHGSLWGACDTALHVSGDRDAPARRIHVVKMKDADPGSDILFQLRQVEIGDDEDGDCVTSCVIEPSELEAIGPGRRRLSPNEQIVSDALGRALEAKGVFPPDAIPENVLNRLRTAKVVDVSEWLSEALPALRKPDTKPDTARRTFDRLRPKLQASEICGIWEDWAWLNF